MPPESWIELVEPHEETAADFSKVDKKISLRDLIAFGIGGSLGAGVFVTVGAVAHSVCGPAIVISTVVASAICAINGLACAEFSARIPAAGGAFSFIRASIGPGESFLTGWLLMLQHGFSGCATARGLADYTRATLIAVRLLPVDETSGWLSHALDFGTRTFVPPFLSFVFSFSILPPLAILVCTFIITLGASESAMFNRLVTSWNVVLILFVSSAGLFYFDFRNFSPTFPFGIFPIFEGAGIMFFAFIGFDAVTTLAEEATAPKKTIPIALLVSLIGTTVLYLLVGVSLIGMVPTSQVDPNAPLANAFAAHNSNYLRILVAVGATTTTFCSTFTSVMGQPRIFARMAKDDLFFSVFGTVNSRTNLPVAGIWITGIACALISGTLNFIFLVRLIAAGTIICYTIVDLGLLSLRYACHDDIRATAAERRELLGVEEGAECRPAICPKLIVFAICSFGVFSFFWSISLHLAIGSTSLVVGCLLVGVSTLGLVGSFVVIACHSQSPSDIAEGFRCPGVPYVPCLGVLANLFVFTSLSWTTIRDTAIYILTGGVVYGFYCLNKKCRRPAKNNFEIT